MAVQEHTINNKINIGIIGYNNSNWIAGQLYIQSLLVGQSLLDIVRIEKTSLFLFEKNHNPTSYQEISPLVKGIHLFDYYYGTSFPILKKSLIALERWRRDKRPFFPKNNLPALLEENHVEIIFPANGLLSKRFSAAQQICWVPDFQHLHLPQFFSRSERLARTLQFKKMARKDDKIILSNPYSYKDACNLAPEAKSKFEL